MTPIGYRPYYRQADCDPSYIQDPADVWGFTVFCVGHCDVMAVQFVLLQTWSFNDTVSLCALCAVLYTACTYSYAPYSPAQKAVILMSCHGDIKPAPVLYRAPCLNCRQSKLRLLWMLTLTALSLVSKSLHFRSAQRRALLVNLSTLFTLFRVNVLGV